MSPMILADLQPMFLKVERDEQGAPVEPNRYSMLPADTAPAAADGVDFLCPKCLFENGGHRPGVHSIICWSPKVEQSLDPTPGRWNMEGTGMADLSLVAGSSSVLLKYGCQAHFHVTKGKVTNCDEPKWDAYPGTSEEPKPEADAGKTASDEPLRDPKYYLKRDDGKIGQDRFHTEQDAVDAAHAAGLDMNRWTIHH